MAGVYNDCMLKRSQGFTLTEMLIVISIIAILATLLSVTWTRVRAKSKLARTSTELQQIAAAVTQYAEDNNYQYPPDVSRSVPPGLQPYLANGLWPTGAWPTGE